MGEKEIKQYNFEQGPVSLIIKAADDSSLKFRKLIHHIGKF